MDWFKLGAGLTVLIFMINSSRYYFSNVENVMETCEFSDSCSFLKKSSETIHTQKNFYVIATALETSTLAHATKLPFLMG